MMKFMFWMMVMAVALSLPSTAFGTTTVADYNFGYTCEGEGPFASVHSWVIYDDIDTYTYYYQILDVSADYRINYLQFEIPEIPSSDLNVWTSSIAGGYSGDSSVFGSLFEVDGVAYAVGMFATTAVTSGKTSWIVYFDSDTGPIESAGMLSGFDPAINDISLCGTVYTPIPEPMTLVLLASGVVFAIRRRKHNES
ncbi:MAG: PEP-CTERM sorting domain-containing protein [Phycisphaerae bacterium]|nr:PEP-CTERM sorting domain-containing protein [Phycisphaerae bacterium]